METPLNSTKPMSHAAFEHVAGFFKVLSEPLRLKILHALCDGERTVAQLMEDTAGNQANVSKHLRVLLDAGLVSGRKEGTNAYYRVIDPVVYDLCDAVRERQSQFLESRALVFKGGES